MGKRAALLASFLAVLLAVASSVKTDKVAKVIGVAKCSDCIKNFNSFEGLHVAVLCKSDDKYYEPEGLSEMTKEGMFNLSIRSSLLKEDGSGLKSQCYVQLYSSSKNTLCPTQAHSDHFKLVLSAKNKDVHVFGIAGGKLSFSHAACDEKTFWPQPFFKLPPFHPWTKYFPKFPCRKPKPPPSPYNPPNPKPPTYSPPMKKPPTYSPPMKKPPTYSPPKTPSPTYKPPKPKPPTYSPPKTPPTYKPPKYTPPTYTPKPKPPTYTPKPKPPTYTPKRKPPTYTPKPKPPPCTPKPTPPTYTPDPMPPTYTPPETPGNPPMKPKFPWHHHIEFPKFPPSLGH